MIGVKMLLAMALISGFSAFAQEDVNLDEVSLGDLLNIEVESASKKAEPLSETPVPVSIITQDMIKLAGVRNLQEALVLFVPGYTDAEDRNESNFAPRGIYATSQQKVLVMVNGHRLNSRSYLTSMPDYGIALHNLERIEVLRGPGSSLYGNVALAGVINLVTKKGKDLKKSSVEVGGGNWGQQRLRFLTGDGGDNWDLLAWGQHYKAMGEEADLDGGDIHNPGKTGKILIDGVDNPQSHDVGAVYRNGNWTYFGASRQSSWIEPYGVSGTTSNPYDYGAYRTFLDAGPGLSMAQQHLGARFNKQVCENWSLEVNPYFDRSEVRAILTATVDDGSIIRWEDQNTGVIAHAVRSFKSGGGESSALVGLQVENMQVTDSGMYGITDGETTSINDTNSNPLLKRGGEDSYSTFFQVKYRLSPRMILNFGARYDYKNRSSGDNYDNVSPRIALIYLPNDDWEFKLSYSQSFVDGPYWYRYNRIAAFGGSEFLDPEILNAYQLQSVWKSTNKHLRNALTLYFQDGKNLIINRSQAAGTSDDPKYVNSGAIESTGIENELQWLQSKYQVFWNFQYYRALTSVEYSKFDDKFSHVPQFTSNLVFNYLFTRDLSANISVRHIGEQVYNVGTVGGDAVEKSVASATLFNLGARYEHIGGTGLFVDGRVYNVADTKHYQGGQSGYIVPYQQAGRWWLASVGTEF